MIDLGLLFVADPVDALGTMVLVFQCSCEMAHRDGRIAGYVGQGWCGSLGNGRSAPGTREQWTDGMERYNEAGTPPTP